MACVLFYQLKKKGVRPKIVTKIKYTANVKTKTKDSKGTTLNKEPRAKLKKRERKKKRRNYKMSKELSLNLDDGK